MAGWVQYIPQALKAAGTYQEGQEQKRAGDANAQLLEDRAFTARQQSTRDEEMQRRESRMFRGKQAAALAEAGIGSEGSGGGLLDQSALFAEFDALNIRYGGDMQAKGLISQAASLRRGGRNAARNSGLLAGGQLLTGVSDYYTRSKMVS
jgi:hypothetical protein